MSSVSTGVNVFHTDWTVVVGSVGNTFVWHVFRKAETTGVTVDEFVPSSDPETEIRSASTNTRVGVFGSDSCARQCSGYTSLTLSSLSHK